MTISPPSDMAEMLASLTAQRKAVRAARNDLRTAGPQAASLIVQAFDYASHEQAEHKGGQMLRMAQRIDAALDEIDKMLGSMAGSTRAASTAVQEFEQKQARAARAARGLKI
jgi:hypothetical protein